MGYVSPERPLMDGESREHWYFERRAELLRVKKYNEGMWNRWVPILAVLIFILILVCVLEVLR